MPVRAALPAPAPASRAAPASSFTAAALVIADLPTWAVRRLDPRLEGRPVVAVDGRRVIGVDALARKAGVRVGDAPDRARGLCPEAAVVPVESPAVDAAWDAAVAAGYRLTPFLDPARRGRLFLSQVGLLEAEALAGELGARVGLAGTRGTAHLAALATGDGTARAVGDDGRFLRSAPVYLLRGAGVPGWVVERLELFGLARLGDLGRLTARQLGAQFGPVAVRLWALANGLDDDPVPTYRPLAEPGASFEFDWPALEPADWSPALERTVGWAVDALGSRAAGAVTVSVRTALGESASRRVLKGPTRDVRTLVAAARLALESALPGGLEFERLAVSLGDLSWPAPVQDSLFGLLERPGVKVAVDRVEGRYPGRLGRMQVVDEWAYLPERRYRFVAIADFPDRPARARRSSPKETAP